MRGGLDYGLDRRERSRSGFGAIGAIKRNHSARCFPLVRIWRTRIKPRFYSYFRSKLNNSSKNQFKCCAQLEHQHFFHFPKQTLLNEKTIFPSTFPSTFFSAFAPAKSPFRWSSYPKFDSRNLFDVLFSKYELEQLDKYYTPESNLRERWNLEYGTLIKADFTGCQKKMDEWHSNKQTWIHRNPCGSKNMGYAFFIK